MQVDNFNCLLNNESKKLKHNDKICNYITQGDGVPIILVPGTGGDEKIFCRIIPRLATSYKVFSISHYHEKYIDDVIDALHDIFLEYVGNEFHLLGTSVGGRIVQYYAQKYPENVKSLIIGNSYVENDTILRKNKINKLLINFIPHSILKNILIKGTKRNMNGRPGEEIFIKYFAEHVNSNTKLELITRVKWNFEKLNPPNIDKSIPKLIIKSADDPLIPPETREHLTKYYPDATVYEFSNGGHFPYFSNADEYANIVLNFLDSLN